MDHTLIEPFCRRELGRKCGQGHWRCRQATLLAPTPSEQTWQQWHLLWNSRSKVRQSNQIAWQTHNFCSYYKGYCNSQTNHFFCIFIPIPFFPSFPYPLNPLISLPPSPVLFPIPFICSSDLITVTVPPFNSVPFYKTDTQVYSTSFILQMAQFYHSYHQTNWLTHSLTIYMQQALLGKLTVLQLVQKYPTFKGNQKFISESKRTHHWSLS